MCARLDRGEPERQCGLEKGTAATFAALRDQARAEVAHGLRGVRGLVEAVFWGQANTGGHRGFRTPRRNGGYVVGTVIVTIAGALGSKGAETLAAEFGKLVIERWSRARAEKFFTAFLDEIGEELREGVELPTTVSRLQLILRDDAASEALFEAYRRVCFARSRDLGPRIIGLLVGQLVVEGRIATYLEEEVFAAAEGMTDDELVGAADFAESTWCRPADSTGWVSGVPAAQVEIEWTKQVRESGLGKGEAVQIGPLPLDECVGTWGLRAQSFGMLGQSMTDTTEEYSADGEYSDEDGSIRRIVTFIRVSPSLFRLAQLVRRAVGASPRA